MHDCIGKRTITEFKSTHPWVNESVVAAVERKNFAKGTLEEEEAAIACSETLLDEFQDFVVRTKEELKSLQHGSKLWWQKSKQLMGEPTKLSSILALKTEDGTWILESGGKADLLAKTFSGKYVLSAQEENSYSDLQISSLVQREVPEPTEPLVAEITSKLKEESGTGPDDLPARVLKRFANILAIPIVILLRIILRTGRWPELWLEHWICPLYKRGAVF